MRADKRVYDHCVIDLKIIDILNKIIMVKALRVIIQQW